MLVLMLMLMLMLMMRAAAHEPDEPGGGGLGGAAAQEAVLQGRVQLRHAPDAERQVQRRDPLLRRADALARGPARTAPLGGYRLFNPSPRAAASLTPRHVLPPL